jgi:hypothetical protein
MNNIIWRKISIISILLILLNIGAHSLLWDVPYIVYSDIDFDLTSKLVDKYLIISLCLIPALILGFILSKIQLLSKYEINFKRGLSFSILIIYSLTLIHITGYNIKNRRIKVKADNSLVSDFLVYDTENIKLYYAKSEVIDYCDDMLEENPHMKNHNLLKNFILAVDSNIIIKREYVFIPDTFRLQRIYDSPDILFDTTQVIDQAAEINSFIRILDYASEKLLREEKFRIYDKKREVFIDFIYYQKIHSGIGNIDLICYFPDGEIFINSRLRFGL